MGMRYKRIIHMRSSGTTNVCDEKQYIVYDYHQPKDHHRKELPTFHS